MEGQFTYQDFDLLIEPDPDGGYRARVLRSPAGESAPARFTLPFSTVELENFVLAGLADPKARRLKTSAASCMVRYSTMSCETRCCAASP
jgi:hypothetical protein